jgi:hypothetical protein
VAPARVAPRVSPVTPKSAPAAPTPMPAYIVRMVFSDSGQPRASLPVPLRPVRPSGLQRRRGNAVVIQGSVADLSARLLQKASVAGLLHCHDTNTRTAISGRSAWGMPPVG